MKKILTIVGARPQFIKASAVSNIIKQHRDLNEIILHTGQHFDKNMSDIFFDQLGIPRPNIQLDIHGGPHGQMTGKMIIEIEKKLIEHSPDRVLVYGDTNSTLAGALAASKMHIPVAHVESGLRSFNMKMPEEINRILTDQVSDLLFCPTETAINNLSNEGFKTKTCKIIKSGDVMQDAALLYERHATPPSKLKITKKFILATLHRAENTNDPERLASIIHALNRANKEIAPVVLPLHPRTRHTLKNLGLDLNVTVLDPVGYLEMIWLTKNSSLVLTDSGGIQKEAFFFGKHCVTMRDQTEWIELVKAGYNDLTGADENKIINATKNHFDVPIKNHPNLYGSGHASDKIVQLLKDG